MRVKFLLYLFFIFFVVVAGRLFYWQIIDGPTLAKAAALEENSMVSVPADRGIIYAADGSILVGNEPAYLLYAATISMTLPPVTVAKQLTPIIYASELNAQNALTLNLGQTLPTINENKINSDLLTALNQSGSYYVPLAYHLTQKYVTAIQALDITGLNFDPEPQRFYPNGAMAADTLGFVGSGSNGNQVGYYGLEGYYDGQLTGQSGLEQVAHDASGQQVLIDSLDIQPPSNGRSIKTTIDPYIQLLVEQQIQAGLVKYGAKQVSAIVMDPKTGDILASATTPTFDPRSYSDFSQNLYTDGNTSDTYEPGSTFKIATMAIGLDTGKITPTTICLICNQSFTVQGQTIETWNNKYFAPGTENMTTVLEHSDNVGALWVANQVGKKTFYKYTQAFGLGSTIGADIAGEQSGVFYPSSASMQPIDLDTMSFGQGFTLTALKMIQITAAIANNGMMMRPRYVSQIIDNGKIINIPPHAVGQVVKPQTAQTLTGMLINAVNFGEVGKIVPHNYDVAGKTGTAQVAVAGHYDPNKYTASFVGFAPASNPKFVILVKYEDPTATIYGALTAEPTFFNIVKELFPYFGLAPSNP